MRTSRYPVPSVRIALVLCAAALFVACGGADESAKPTAAEAAAEAQELTASEAHAQGILDERFPSDGTRIEAKDGLLTVFARHVARFGVLRRLAVRYRFELIDWSDEDSLVDVYVENVALETALARLIEPTPYSVAYSHDSETDQNQVIQVVIGEAPPELSEDEKKQARRDSKDAEGLSEAEERRYKPRSAEEAARRMAERELRQERRKAEALADIESDDPTVREDAVATGLDANDPVENSLLTDLALGDPDPRVRLEAVKQLGFGAATMRLAKGLSSRDPEHVAEILNDLSYLDDEAAGEAIKEMFDDPNPIIDEAARDAHQDWSLARGR